MFDNTLTIESILENESRALSSEIDGRIVFSIENKKGKIIANGEGSTVISALNRSLKDYAYNFGYENVNYIHMSRKKDLAMSEYLADASMVVESENERIKISYLKNSNFTKTSTLDKIDSRGFFCDDFTLLYGQSFQKTYTQLSDIERSGKDIVLRKNKRYA